MLMYPLIFLLTVQICFYCKRRTTLQRRKHVMPACAQCSLHENRITESVDPSNTMISWSIWPSTSEVDAVASSTLFGACLLVSYIICPQQHSRVDIVGF
jgi:hypothetical protein